MGTTGAAPERVVALRVLGRVRGGAYADRAFAGEARRAGLEGRARARAHRLAFGAVQRARTLDWLEDRFLDRPASLEEGVRDVLRLGAYELAYSDGAADAAVVDQAVRLARGLPGAPRRADARAGLVNAVLRRMAAEGRPRLASLPDGTAAEAALAHSVPDWIAERLFAAVAPDLARGVLRAANEPAESAMRWNPLRGPRATLEAELPPERHGDPLLPEAYVLDAPFALEESAAWARGRAIAQSRASMLPARVLDPRPGERILDLCGAPGAKATHIAALTGNRAEVVSVELRPARAEALRRLARRLGARVEVIEGDARVVPLEGRFDAALVDPPCTGLGVLAARPDARWRRREAAVPALAELQRGLLERALAEVGPAGRVVYSTCTLLPEENEGVVAAAGARIEPIGGGLGAAYGHPAVPGALLTLPGRDGTDGFFVARVRPGGPAAAGPDGVG